MNYKETALYFVAGANLGWSIVGLIKGYDTAPVIATLLVGLSCLFLIWRRQ